MPTNPEEVLAEFRALINSRDCAAYRMVDIAMAACAYMNLGEVAKAQNILQGALLDFQLADEKITKFYKAKGSHAHKIPAKSAEPTGENNNGNSSNQSIA